MKTDHLKTYVVTDTATGGFAKYLGESPARLTHIVLFGVAKLLYDGKPWCPHPDFWEIEEIQSVRY